MSPSCSINGFTVTTPPQLASAASTSALFASFSIFIRVGKIIVRVPASAMLPGVKGLRGPLSCLTQARYGIAWGGVGAALACFDEALQYSKERIIFDKPLAGFQLAQAKLAEMGTQITMGQMLALRLGRLKDEGTFTPQQVSMAKRNNVRLGLETARTCRDMLGANGISLEYQTGRHMLNLESVITYEGTHDIHTLIVGHELTGLPAYA